MSGLKPRWLWTIVIGTVLLAVAILLDVSPFLRGGFGWRWPYQLAVGRVLPLLVAVGLYVSGCWLLLRRTGRNWPLLWWAFAGSVVLPLAALTVRTDDLLFELFARTISGMTTGPHLAAARLDWAAGEWLDWPVFMDSMMGLSGHVALSPPGNTLVYGGLNRLLSAVPGVSDPLFRALLPLQCHNSNLLNYTPAEWASAWFGILMPLWAALAVFPLYGVGRVLGMARQRWVLTWWPLVPSLVIFAPTWNTLYPALSVAAFWLLLIGLRRQRGYGWAFGAGLLVSWLTFANLSLVPFLGFMGLYVLLALLSDAGWQVRLLDWQRMLMLWGSLVAGSAIIWLIFWLVSGVSPLAIFVTSLTPHLELDRPYLPWLWNHTWEWVLLTGLPLVAVWLLAAVGKRKLLAQQPVVGLTLLLTLLIVLLSGTARGETGRVWLFFAPLVLLAAAEGLPYLLADDAADGKVWLTLTAAQAILLITLVVSWDMIGAGDIVRPPSPPGGLQTVNPVEVAWDDFRLAGWETDVSADHITLRLDWQAQSPMTTAYWFSALLVDPAGVPAGEAVLWQPLETRYPTTCWAVGEWVGDTVVLPLPLGAEAGEWWISLAGIADVSQPEARLPLVLPDGASDTQIGLGPVIVHAE